jgi:hypothetical protein
MPPSVPVEEASSRRFPQSGAGFVGGLDKVVSSHNLLQLMPLRCLHPPLAVLCTTGAHGVFPVTPRRGPGAAPMWVG